MMSIVRTFKIREMQKNNIKVQEEVTLLRQGLLENHTYEQYDLLETNPHFSSNFGIGRKLILCHLVWAITILLMVGNCFEHTLSIVFCIPFKSNNYTFTNFEEYMRYFRKYFPEYTSEKYILNIFSEYVWKINSKIYFKIFFKNMFQKN